MKSLIKIFAIIPVALFAWAVYCILSAPPDPLFGDPHRAAVIAYLNHRFMVAAYTIVWAIQLGYLAWLGMKWRSQKQEAERAGGPDHPGKSPAR